MLGAMNVSARIAATVGPDVLGRTLRARLRAEGLSAQLHEQPGARTPLLVQFLPRPAHREMLSFRAAETDVVPEVRLTRACRWLHVAALPRARSAIASLRRVAERACARGMRVSLDLNARPRLHRAHGALPPGARRLLALADVVKASDDDLAVLQLGPEELAALLARPAVLVVTRGSKRTTVLGAALAKAPRNASTRLDVRPSPRRVPDVTGAGDALCAGLIAHLLGEPRWPSTRDDWRRAVEAGHRAAARRLGARG